MTGLTIAVDDDEIIIQVPRTLPPAARITAVTALAAAIGAPAPACTTLGTWTQVSADRDASPGTRPASSPASTRRDTAP